MKTILFLVFLIVVNLNSANALEKCDDLEGVWAGSCTQHMTGILGIKIPFTTSKYNWGTMIYQNECREIEYKSMIRHKDNGLRTSKVGKDLDFEGSLADGCSMEYSLEYIADGFIVSSKESCKNTRENTVTKVTEKIKRNGLNLTYKMAENAGRMGRAVVCELELLSDD